MSNKTQTTPITKPKNIFEAMIEVQKRLPTAPKDSKNPHFKSTYTKLSTAVEVVRPILIEFGVIMNHNQDNSHIMDGIVGVETKLVHAESQTSMSTTLFAKPAKGLDPQSVGGCITYLSRYGIFSLVGLTTDDDDDGNYISQPGSQENLEPMRTQLMALAKEKGIDTLDIQKACMALGRKSLSECTKQDLAALIGRLRATK